MNRSNLIVAAFAGVVALVLAANSLYMVGQMEQVVVLRLGALDRVVNAGKANGAGLHLKVPFVENLVRFDKRNLSLERTEEEITSADQEKMVVDAFVRYRILDPRQFYQRARSQAGGEALLQRLVNSSLREALGTANTSQIVSEKRDQLMRQVRDDVARRVAASQIGVQIIDLRIRRADLPEANQEAVFRRMQSQREQEARQSRTDGEQKAREVLGAATKEAETIQGQADAERARIFAASYGKDPAFAAFTRSLKAYETSLANKETTLVLSPDDEFFRYFKQGPGR